MVREYIQNGIQEKNKIAKGTIRFVDEQLREITDTLIINELNLQSFKAGNNNKKIQIGNSKKCSKRNFLM